MGKKDTFLCKGFLVLRWVPPWEHCFREARHIPQEGPLCAQETRPPHGHSSPGVSDRVDGALSGSLGPRVISQVLFTNTTKMQVEPVWEREL